MANEAGKRKKNEMNELSVYNNQYLAVSNEYLEGRTMQTNLLEGKTEMLAIVKLSRDFHEEEKVDDHGNTYIVKYVDIKTKELREINNTGSHSFYDNIIKTAISLKKKLMITYDSAERKFCIKSLYGDIVYDKGNLRVYFNPETTKLVQDLSKSYTKIPLDILFSMKTVGGFGMYKMFKKEMYKLGPVNASVPQEEQEMCMIRFENLNDFRFQLGFLDFTQADVKNEIDKEMMRGIADFDRISELDSKPKYSRFSDLKKRIILPGIEELNKKSDIYVAHFDKLTTGHGGKIYGVEFIIQRNLQFELDKENKVKKKSKVTTHVVDSGKNSKSVDTEIDKIEFLNIISDIIPVHLKMREYTTIAEASDYQIHLVEKAVDVLLSQKKPIDNVAGFLVSAIKNGYERPIKMGFDESSYPEFEQEPAVEYREYSKEEKEGFESFMDELRSQPTRKRNKKTAL